MMLGTGLAVAGALLATVGLVILVGSLDPRVRRFWPYGAAITCGGLVASGAGDLILRHWYGWTALFMASVLLGIIAKVASTAPGVR